MTSEMGSLFAGLPSAWPAEVFETLAQGRGVRIERILSRGHTTPETGWFDQDQDEWVMVAAGRARLCFEGPDETMEMGPGDWVLIKAHRHHRVTWTDPEQVTVWLAVHFEG